MLREKEKIIQLTKLVPLISVIIISLVLISVVIFGVHKYFKEESKKIESKIIFQTVQIAKNRMSSIHEIIHHVNKSVIDFSKSQVKLVVDIGYEIVDSTYKQNKTFPKEIIIHKIINRLKDIRFYKDKSGYYFIYAMDGKLLMLPIKPELQGMNFINVKDLKGNYLIKDIISKLHKKDAVFKSWYYYKPSSKKILEKLGYIKLYKPLNIFIGSAIYYDNLVEEIDKKIVHMLHSVSAINNDNVLVFSNNKLLYGNKFILPKNKYSKIEQFIKKHKYFYKKIDNIIVLGKYLKTNNLGFTIIEQVDLNKINKMIKKQQVKLDKVLNNVLKKFIFITLILVLLMLIITNYLTKLIHTVFDRYEQALIDEKEKAEIAAKAKGEFLANMSHEIRTPLNAMFGFIRILQEKEEDKENQKYLNIIEKSGQNLLSIINDILDFSKIESGKFHIENIEFNPKEEIEIIHNLFASKASEKNILLEINENNLKYNIISDPTRIKQVVANLLSNAIKFTPENKKIILNIHYFDEIEILRIEVIDEGIGIPKEKLEHIFEAFSQADTSTTRKFGGTGLGLTISYRLVELMGGELKVESEVGKGSKFYFEIPAKKGGIAKEIIEHKQKILNDIFNYHILIVEDNIANQMFMKVILKKMGLTFDIANNGKEAIEKYKTKKYDFILMDENMPEMNGIEATKYIRQFERDNHLDHTIIIALTANALEGDKERFILAGMDYYLSKPLDIEKLKEIFVEIENI